MNVRACFWCLVAISQLHVIGRERIRDDFRDLGAITGIVV